MEQKSQLIFEVEPNEMAYVPPNRDPHNDDANQEDRELTVRLDKWLWAARFFKTRALARSAVEQGKVYYNGQKTLPSTEIEVGATVLINQGKAKKFVIIRRLSTRRRNTDETNSLYEEVALERPPTANNWSSPAISSFEADKKPRKVVRFLRRAFSMDEPG
jgi:ribosome-associated heat shock protein Hsp15